MRALHYHWKGRGGKQYHLGNCYYLNLKQIPLQAPWIWYAHYSITGHRFYISHPLPLSLWIKELERSPSSNGYQQYLSDLNLGGCPWRSSFTLLLKHETIEIQEAMLEWLLVYLVCIGEKVLFACLFPFKCWMIRSALADSLLVSWPLLLNGGKPQSIAYH